MDVRTYVGERQAHDGEDDYYHSLRSMSAEMIGDWQYGSLMKCEKMRPHADAAV